jgi:tetratricopeptide (TPR) repeat protein
MFDAALYNRVVNWPGPRELALVAAAGAGLVLVAALLLALKRLRRVAFGLIVVGVAAVYLALFVAHEQRVSFRPSEGVTVHRPRYSDGTRSAIEWAFLALPGGVLVAVGVWTLVRFLTRRRLRATVPGHLKEALRRYYHGDLGGALAECDLAVALAPERGDAYAQRGCVYEARGEADRALADFDRAVRLDPQLAVAYQHRGRLRAAGGDLDAALADFGRALELRPNNAEVLLHRGACLARKGLHKDAVEDFEWVLRLTNDEQYAGPARQHLRRLGADAGTDTGTTPPLAGAAPD